MGTGRRGGVESLSNHTRYCLDTGRNWEETGGARGERNRRARYTTLREDKAKGPWSCNMGKLRTALAGVMAGAVEAAWQDQAQYNEWVPWF